MVPEFLELSLVRVVKNKSRIQSKRSILEKRQNSTASNDAEGGDPFWDASKKRPWANKELFRQLGWVR